MSQSVVPPVNPVRPTRPVVVRPVPEVLPPAESQPVEGRPRDEARPPVDARTVAQALESMGMQIQHGDRTLAFSYDPDLNRVIVRVTSRATGELIRQIPPEEYLALASRFRELFGVLIDEEA